MKLIWDKTCTIVVVFGALFLLAIILAGNQFYLNAIERQYVQASNELETEQKILDKIQENEVVEKSEASVQTSRRIQQQLPVTPLLDQVFLEVERAARTADSVVHEIDISYSEEPTVVLGYEKVAENNNLLQAKEIEWLTFELQLSNEDYNAMVEFIDTLEQSQRILQIETLHLDEVESDKITRLEYTLVFTTFYYPGQGELEGETPNYDYGAPPAKEDPF